MRLKLSIVVAVCFCFMSAVSAQVVRFQTSMGDFDMVLNPTNNPVLQGNVDNLLQYVESNRYDNSWINRADTGFVLQMGGFYSHTRRPPPTIDSIRPFAAFAPVAGEPAAENPGLSNTVGTVSFALSGLPTGGTNQDSGTSSFFVNLTSNTFLDPDFTVFAAIPDMTVVNNIMALMTKDRTTETDFGAEAGNLAFEKVPIQGDGQQVFIKRAFILTDAMSVARAVAGVQSVMSQSADSFLNPSAEQLLASSAADKTTSAPGLLSTIVPEPTSVALAAMALSSLGFFARCRRRKKPGGR